MIATFRKGFSLAALLIFSLTISAQISNTYNAAATWTVPPYVSSLTITVYGGGGGIGGRDCRGGCTNAPVGQVGYVRATYAVIAGNVIGIYPGGRGVNGASDAQGTGGGAGGTDTYPSANYNGGRGGHAGSTGQSGAGGGGGAASVVTLNGSIIIVAGGAAGGGGMGNAANSGRAGNNATSSNGLSTGGNGGTPSGDGGGGGGGGGGQFAGSGGATYVISGSSERAGNGGYRGANRITAASSTLSNTSANRTTAGQVIITYISTLPVSYLSFTASPAQNNVILKWSTATEQNSADFEIQRRGDNTDWKKIGVVAAAGNSNTTKEYSFVDEDPLHGTNYYRLAQNDLDGKQNISKIISVNKKTTSSLNRIYPNPVINGKLTISLNESATIYVYANVGNKLLEKTLAAGQHTLDLSKFARGTYFIRINNQTETFIIK